MATGLPPGKTAVLISSITDHRGTDWRGEGHYEIRNDGTLNTAEHRSLGGTYSGIDVGGPFWSVQPPGGTAYLDGLKDTPDLPLSPAPNGLEPLRYDLTLVVDGETIGAETVVRPQLAEGVHSSTALPGDLRGIFFTPCQSAIGAVLVLGGSEGGITAGRAAALAAEGYAALALGYFDYEDRPKAAIDLPIKYFGDAVQFLKQQTGHDAVIWGGSRGSEAAMLTAIHCPQHVAGVIAWVPSHLVNPGFDMAGGEDFSASTTAMWTYAGAPIEGVPSAPMTDAIRTARARGYARVSGYAYSPEFEQAWAAVGPDSRFAIPVEEIAEPLCIISAEEDALWPSALSGKRLCARRKAAGLADQTTMVSLAKCGHAIGMPNMPRPFSHTSYWSAGYSGVEAGFIAQGGTPATNAVAAREGWGAALSFIDSVFERV